MQPKSLDYSLIKISKNNADLEAKAYFLHYVGEHSRQNAGMIS
jgi:hypothetical protein